MFHGTIGLAQIGALLKSLFRSFPISLVAVTTVPPAARTRLLPAAAGLARALFTAPHDRSRKFMGIAADRPM
jgi:hypothetical protein